MSRHSPAALRLRALSGVQQAPSSRLELFRARGFISADECAPIIERIDAKRRPSSIADDLGDELFRTSETCDLDGRDAVVAALDDRICDLLGIDPALGEPLQGQRYAAGQEFKPHTDYFEPGGLDYKAHCSRSGQRTWTAMVYLNEPEAGGATLFKRIDKRFRPETGTLLAWNNLLADDRPNPATLHHGMKVRRGTKYIVTKWFRQRPWPRA